MEPDDDNAVVKAEITARMCEVSNPAVSAYIQDVFLTNLTAAGPAAGIWLEQLEARWALLADSPRGVMSDFTPQEFEDLHYVLFGYRSRQT